MLNENSSIVRFTKWLALALSVLITFGVPAGFLHYGYQEQISEIRGEMNSKVRLVSQMIGSNPQFWQFEGLRIGELIKDAKDTTFKELNRVLDNEGNVVAQEPVEAPVFSWPVVTRSKPLYDYGTQVGRIEITHSMRRLYERAILVGFFSLSFGILIFWGLRVLPLRLLDRSWARISYLASHDAMTGLSNRLAFVDRLEQTLVTGSRDRTSVAVYAIDLDHFKDINDTLGHSAGDLLLKLAAERMKACLREGDQLARPGGDEFSLFQTGIDQPHIAAALAERIICELAKPFDLDGQKGVIGASIGIAMHNCEDVEHADQLLSHADLALYRSKNGGRGTYHFFEEEMDAELKARKGMEEDIREALNNEEFELHYQPQVDLSSQQIIGLEVLLRWHHRERGDVPPDEIIPVAETSGLIRPLTEWILAKACRDTLEWAPLRTAVNLSPSLFKQNGVVAMVERVLKETGFPPQRLELEITEEILIDDFVKALSTLKELREIGVHFAMDDFGTGYSSLNYLRQFPFEKIKIDRSFITNVNSNTGSQGIVRAIINMGDALEMKIIAEGVETIEEADALMAEGCEEVQGYLYGRPMKKKDIEAVLASTGTLTKPSDGDDAQLVRA